MREIDVFLLAGGRSTRMGRDKAGLALGRRTFLDAIADAARPMARSLAVVGRDHETGGLAAVADLRPGCGPLAGIESALTRATTPDALVVACDVPLVSTALLELLVDRARREPDTIVAPEDADGWLAPLCGVYPVAALVMVSTLLDAGERRPRALLDRFPSRIVTFAEYQHLPRSRDLLRNVNTPAEYEALGKESFPTSDL